MTDEKNIPGAPDGAQQVFLKSIRISGTDLMWFVGKAASYTKADGTTVSAKIQGMAVAQPPPKPDGTPNFSVQVHIQFDDGYTDIYIAEDHLVIRNIEVSVLAIPKKTLLVPKR